MRFEIVKTDSADSAKGQLRRVWRRRWAVALCALGLSLALGLAAMTSLPSAQASQRQYPVVALTCGTDLRLCRALVQALSEMEPTHLYRINPKPHPPQAFAIALDMDADGTARLRWQDGAGGTVTRGGHNDAEFARHIVKKAGPALAEALKRSRLP